MNIKLSTFFSIIAGAILFIMSLVMYEIIQLYQATNKLALIEHQRYEMTRRADELRQSSDDLTRMARTYAITKDPQYKSAYFKILAIRDGKAPRPQNYEDIYWDLSKKLREMKHPNGKAISLEDAMKKLPYSKHEIEKLYQSKKSSDQLAQYEINSFTDVDKNRSMQSKAITLLHSKQYHKAKEKIMLPIDTFLFSIKHRTQLEIDATHNEIKSIYTKLLILFILAIIIIFTTMYVIIKKVLNPIAYLHETILAFKDNKKDLQKRKFYKDEIGQMIEQFFDMKEKLEKDKEKLRLLATTDPLTKIYNRRAFFEIANSFFKLSKREHTPLSFMLLDIDFFKKVNDTYGHIIGDEILKHLVKNVRINLRKSDLFGRYGGEEFVILLPNSDSKSAQTVAENIRQHIEQTPFQSDTKKIYITISIGYSSLKDEDTTISDIITRADQALYKAKRNGRNRVEGEL